MKYWSLAAFLLLVFAPGGLRAQDPRPPEEKAFQNIPYRSGGVGTDERAALEALASRYNLKLIFARAQSTAFVSEVRVRILDGEGKTVLDAVSEGPWFYADLPPGKYRVEATIGAQTLEKTADVAAGRPTRLAFYWDIQRD